MPPNSGANRYEIKELLGEGGMGVVYRALDTRTKSFVALKTLRDETDSAMLDMFKREWELLGEVPHPNIVDIRDVDEIEINGVRKPCFIMPLLPGCTLSALIKSASPRLTTEFVVNMVSQVCKGLQAAHEKDLVHRDLKPSNIFIMEDDTAKIIDFGLVHAVGNKSITGVKGTWQYMAPEQIDNSKAPNRSFDIYSLGVVAYEALTGHQPFKRGNFADTDEAIRYFVPQAISERNPKVPVMVGKAVHVAMAKQPNARYATAREFSETLQKAFRNEYIERFDPAKTRPRIERAKKAFGLGDSEFAAEILTELEAEGNLDADITLLRAQIDEFNKQKRVRQLYEAAQTRLEQDEIPLALEKLQEILKLDPQNSDAIKLRKKIEQQRSQQQVAEWLDLARKHLDRHDFSEARRALKEVFNLKYDDPEAAELKAQVDAREKEVDTARAEKETLYGSALRHNNNGEISSALSKLERLLELSRNTPGASVPERDKVFQAFYNDVRTERDRVDNAYSEGTRHLAEKNFEKALGICDGILYKYPHNAQFQALRLKIEHSQRQDLSAYIAEVGRAVETEPNLDRRVGLLEDACKRYPNEAGFGRQLSLAKELRDLVGSIVARARNYEEQNQFAEAITQWNTLANIHPQYPGIDFEINQLERRRETQAEEDKKSRFVERIDRALGNGAYADAERLSNEGLAEFPNNPELTALLRLSRQGLDQTREANRLFEEAKVQRTAGDWDQAVALLRKAFSLDKGNIVVQNTLVKLLTERALSTLDSDPTAAEPFAAEAARLDPEHPSVHKVTDLIAQAKRKHYVEQTVLQARELQNAHRGQAIDILKQGLTVYPNDGRLQQTLSNLQKEEHAWGATQFGLVTEDKTVVYPPNGGVVESPHPHAPSPVRPLVTPPRPTNFVPSAKQQQQQPPAPPKPEAPKSPEQPKGSSVLKKTREASTVVAENLKEKLGSGPHIELKGVIIGVVASIIAIVLGYLYLNRKTDTSVNPIVPVIAQAAKTVKLNITPPDATAILDGSPIGAITPPLADGSTHHISISRPGYKTIDNPAIKVAGPEWPFTLPLEPLQISVSVSESNGTIWIDDQQVDKLEDGAWSSSFALKSAQEHHVLSVKNKTGNPLFQIAFTSVPGKPVAVEPFQTKDLLVTSSFGKEVIVYADNPASSLVIPNQQPKPLSAQGTSGTLDDPSAGFSISTGKKTESRTLSPGAGSTLSVTLNAQVSAVRATVSVEPKTAKLYVDGGLVPHMRNGIYSWRAAPRTYDAKLTAENMEDMKFSITLKKGTDFTHHYDMKAKATATAATVPTGPNPPTLIINGGEPGATVYILNGAVLGVLDAKGNGRFNTAPGAYTIEISKPGYSSNGFAVTMVTGKDFEPKGEKKLLKLVAGYARVVSIRPSDATVTYSRAGEPETHHAALGARLTLTPGTYEFSADAPKFIKKSFSVNIDPNQDKAITFDLLPVNSPVSKNFVDPNEAKPVNGNWYHGTTNNFIRLLSDYRLNTILWSNSYKIKKMSWRVYLDPNNMITYTLDSKALTIVRRINGLDAPDKVRETDFTSTEASAAYAVKIRLERNAVTIAGQKGGTVIPTTDDKHDWSQAKIFIKGDAYFTFWPGR